MKHLARLRVGHPHPHKGLLVLGRGDHQDPKM